MKRPSGAVAQVGRNLRQCSRLGALSLQRGWGVRQKGWKSEGRQLKSESRGERSESCLDCPYFSSSPHPAFPNLSKPPNVPPPQPPTSVSRNVFEAVYASVSRFSRVRLFATPWTVSPAGLLCPWNSPGKNTEVGCRFLLQGIFPTQGLNPGLPHCRQILYHLSHQGS